MNSTNMIIFFLRLQVQLQILHWQTTKYARHLAYGETYETLTPLIDEFIEIYQSKYGRIYLEENSSTIPIYNITDQELEHFLEHCVETLNEMSSLLEQNDVDLFNIKDEMLAAINKLNYLLTLE